MRPKMNLAFLRKLWPKRDSSSVLHTPAPESGPEPSLAAAAAAKNKHPVEVEKAALSSSSRSSSQSPSPVPAPPLEECPICHDPVGVANPEGVVEAWTGLHCGHRFGTACIQTWLQSSLAREPNANPSCPVCRATAKHPRCGHLVCPAPLPSLVRHGHGGAAAAGAEWDAARAAGGYGHFLPTAADRSPPPAAAPTNGRRRVRRRLVRRQGPPRSVVASPPPRRPLQTVGDCTTCRENAAFDARMRSMAAAALAAAQQRLERDRETSGGGGGGGSYDSTAASAGSSAGSSVNGGSGGGRQGLKSLIPALGLGGLKRSGAGRATIVTTALDQYDDDDDDEDDDTENESMTLQSRWRRSHVCGGARLARVHARSPTPGPSQSRRLSI
ncbi:hypothetical protein GGR56DRAFT_95568 [Xylariaceae sp. FL0804]|nr:hypothetical protein GGR56DRAFT_95568 [Xylariaceae sp. FL0804]